MTGAPLSEALARRPARRASRAGELRSVPFLDLGRIHHDLRDEVLVDLGRLIDTGAFSNGPQIEAFENAFAAAVGAAHCVGMASGLDALRIALEALGIGAGDEVVLPALTFVATLEAVVQVGATPIVADVSRHDFELDVDAAAAALTSRTRAVLPVHLYGQMADMRGLLQLADRHGLAVVEDACQAHLAHRDGLVAGAGGSASAFSFYPGKNLGAFGDAGALVTGDAAIDEAARALREHGQRRKYHHDVLGYTARLDTIQAAVLLRKLERLPSWNRERADAARWYSEALTGVGDLELLPVPTGSAPAWHLFPVRTSFRAELEQYLGARGIGTGRHYPFALHQTAAYDRAALPPVSCPVAEALANELLSLPLFPGITEAELEAVTAAVEGFFRERPHPVRDGRAAVPSPPPI